MSVGFGNPFGNLAVMVTYLSWIATIIVNVAFAIGVLSDAGEVQRSGSRLFPVGPFVWALATLFGGVFVAGLYWAIHHSALRRADGGTKPPGFGGDGL